MQYKNTLSVKTVRLRSTSYYLLFLVMQLKGVISDKGLGILGFNHLYNYLQSCANKQQAL